MNPLESPEVLQLLGQLPDSAYRYGVIFLAAWLWRIERRMAVLVMELHLLRAAELGRRNPA